MAGLQVEEQLRALRDNGLNSYILYDPEGTYDLENSAATGGGKTPAFLCPGTLV